MNAKKSNRIDSIEFQIPLKNGPYQNNGASPWYTQVVIGTPGITMKINFDTGARFSWLTSTQCNTVECKYNSDGSPRTRFDPDSSDSFSWVDRTKTKLNFGPWGVMSANKGSDFVNIEETTSVVKKLCIDSLYLVTKYSGEKFRELNWDGGFGIPTGHNPDALTFHFVKALVDQGLLDPSNAEISFYTDRDSKSGFVRIGSFIPESALVDLSSETVLPYQFSPKAPELEYIWTTPLDSMRVGAQKITFDSQIYFCLDTGASQLKGDPQAMVEAFTLITNEINEGRPAPPLFFDLPDSVTVLELTEKEYKSVIEAGADKGQEIIDIVPLKGLPFALIGSLILDHLYTRYIYKTAFNGVDYNVVADEVRIYNKLNGPRIIKKRILKK